MGRAAPLASPFPVPRFGFQGLQNEEEPKVELVRMRKKGVSSMGSHKGVPRGDNTGVVVVGVCMLASVAALALWFSTEMNATKSENLAGPESAPIIQTSATEVSLAAWLPEGVG